MQWIAMEFFGKGDPMFGGSADDRPLGKDGAFIKGTYHRSDVATFDSKEDGERAATAATNRREGGLISVFERARGLEDADFIRRSSEPVTEKPKPAAPARRERKGFDPIDTWDGVLGYVRLHHGAYYWPPLNVVPVFVQARVRGREIRVTTDPRDADPFDADEGHLDRFYVRTGDWGAPERMAAALESRGGVFDWTVSLMTRQARKEDLIDVCRALGGSVARKETTEAVRKELDRVLGSFGFCPYAETGFAERRGQANKQDLIDVLRYLKRGEGGKGDLSCGELRGAIRYLVEEWRASEAKKGSEAKCR